MRGVSSNRFIKRIAVEIIACAECNNFYIERCESEAGIVEDFCAQREKPSFNLILPARSSRAVSHKTIAGT